MQFTSTARESNKNKPLIKHRDQFPKIWQVGWCGTCDQWP